MTTSTFPPVDRPEETEATGADTMLLVPTDQDDRFWEIVDLVEATLTQN